MLHGLYDSSTFPRSVSSMKRQYKPSCCAGGSSQSLVLVFSPTPQPSLQSLKGPHSAQLPSIAQKMGSDCPTIFLNQRSTFFSRQKTLSAFEVFACRKYEIGARDRKFPKQSFSLIFAVSHRRVFCRLRSRVPSSLALFCAAFRHQKYTLFWKIKSALFDYSTYFLRFKTFLSFSPYFNLEELWPPKTQNHRFTSKIASMVP